MKANAKQRIWSLEAGAGFRSAGNYERVVGNEESFKESRYEIRVVLNPTISALRCVGIHGTGNRRR